MGEDPGRYPILTVLVGTNMNKTKTKSMEFNNDDQAKNTDTNRKKLKGVRRRQRKDAVNNDSSGSESRIDAVKLRRRRPSRRVRNMERAKAGKFSIEDLIALRKIGYGMITSSSKELENMGVKMLDEMSSFSCTTTSEDEMCGRLTTNTDYRLEMKKLSKKAQDFLELQAEAKLDEMASKTSHCPLKSMTQTELIETSRDSLKEMDIIIYHAWGLDDTDVQILKKSKESISQILDYWSTRVKTEENLKAKLARLQAEEKQLRQENERMKKSLSLQSTNSQLPKTGLNIEGTPIPPSIDDELMRSVLIQARTLIDTKFDAFEERLQLAGCLLPQSVPDRDTAAAGSSTAVEYGGCLDLNQVTMPFTAPEPRKRKKRKKKRNKSNAVQAAVASNMDQFMQSIVTEVGNVVGTKFDNFEKSMEQSGFFRPKLIVKNVRASTSEGIKNQTDMPVTAPETPKRKKRRKGNKGNVEQGVAIPNVKEFMRSLKIEMGTMIGTKLNALEGRIWYEDSFRGYVSGSPAPYYEYDSSS